LTPDEPDRARVAQAIAAALARLTGSGAQRELLVVEIDDLQAPLHPLADTLLKAGFISTYGGLQYRPPRAPTEGGRAVALARLRG
ncbi:MAG: hypothetical protein JWM82_256, partial [Myxococcales bacterium]|nr:hypothetical protein [Myxococcales bacterium]